MQPSRFLIAAAFVAFAAGVHAQTAISGKAATYPIKITQPGSYKLTSNLDVPAGASAIVISSPNVVLDLNGFAVVGPASCLTLGGCNMVTNDHHGIASSAPNVSIRNGSIKGFQGSGILIAGASVLEDLMIDQNAGHGVVGGSQQQGMTLVNRVRATANRLHGFWLMQSVVTQSMAARNGQHGFSLNFSSLIDGYASGNVHSGVWGGSHLLVRGMRGDYNIGGNFGGNYTSAGGNMSDWTLF